MNDPGVRRDPLISIHGVNGELARIQRAAEAKERGRRIGHRIGQVAGFVAVIAVAIIGVVAIGFVARAIWTAIMIGWHV